MSGGKFSFVCVVQQSKKGNAYLHHLIVQDQTRSCMHIKFQRLDVAAWASQHSVPGTLLYLENVECESKTGFIRVENIGSCYGAGRNRACLDERLKWHVSALSIQLAAEKLNSWYSKDLLRVQADNHIHAVIESHSEIKQDIVVFKFLDILLPQRESQKVKVVAQVIQIHSQKNTLILTLKDEDETQCK